MWKCLNKQELIAMRGVPGSGKSTWAEAWVAGGDMRARINGDDIRKQLFGTYFGPKCDEKVILRVHDAMIRALLDAGYSVIVDNTHTTLKPLRRLKNLVGNRAVFRVVEIDVPLEVALERNAARERVVPENVIREMYERMHTNPIPEEWKMFP